MTADPLHSSALQVKLVQSASGRTDPDRAASILQQAENMVASKALRVVRIMLINRENAALRVIPAKAAAESAGPDGSHAVLQQGPDIPVADAAGLPGIRKETGETSVFRFKTVQAPVGSDPDISPAVLQYGPDIVIGDAVRIAGFRAKCGESVAVILVQSVLGPDPDESFPILDETMPRALGNSTGLRKIPEIDCLWNGGREGTEGEEKDSRHEEVDAPVATVIPGFCFSRTLCFGHGADSPSFPYIE